MKTNKIKQKAKYIENILQNCSSGKDGKTQYSRDCLIEEEIRSIYSGTITNGQREEVYSHLRRCPGCRTDVREYIKEYYKIA